MTAFRDALKLGAAGAAAAACIYYPQPLAARLEQAFDTTPFWGAMPMTLAFIVLTSGPLLFGRLITVARAMRIVIVTEVLLAVLFAAQAFASSPGLWFALRGLQVLLLPLLIPAVITGASNLRDSDNRARDLAFYTAGTIVGGVAGRLLAVASIALAHWQLGSLTIAALLLASVALLRRPPVVTDELAPAGTGNAPAPATPRSWMDPVTLSYPGLALAFAVLTTILTCLPFEVGYERGGTLMLAVVYGGYAVGIVTSLGAPAITRVSRGLPRATLAAGALFTLGLAGVIHGAFAALAIGVVLMCAGMVFQQATQIVMLNAHFARSQSGTVNALFVAAVFAGGTLGSSAMVWLYGALGWTVVLIVCVLLAVIAGACMTVAARSQARAASA